MATIPKLGFIDAPQNRAGDLRGNPQWLAQQLDEPASLAYIFVGDRPAISVKDKKLAIESRSPQSVRQEFPDAEYVLLHINENDQAVFAFQLDEKNQNIAASDQVKLIDLRSLAMQASLPSSDIGALAQARSLLSWHIFHKFCANCGAKTASVDAGYRRDCPKCQRQHFPPG